jgi:ATP-dependent Clp protease ATP-binding subunit ClpX
LEEAMLDIMYEVPQMKDVVECIITEEVITQGAQPRIVFQEKAERKSA